MILIETFHRSHQSEHRGTIGRRHLDPSASRGKASIDHEREPELIYKKPKASLLVCHVYAHKMQAKVGTAFIKSKPGSFRALVRIRLLRELHDAVRKPVAGKRIFLGHVPVPRASHGMAAGSSHQDPGVSPRHKHVAPSKCPSERR